MKSMANCNCPPCEVDYKKVVQEIRETLALRESALEETLRDEKSTIKYIEQKAVLYDIKHLRDCIYSMFDYCKKPVEQSSEGDTCCKCEDEPLEKYKLKELDWSQIAAIAKRDNPQDFLELGDTKDVIVNGQTYQVQIIDFKKDGGGINFMFKDAFADEVMNEEATNEGGWAKCYMANKCLKEIYNSLPEDLKNVIIDVTKDGFTSKLFLPSETELDGKNCYGPVNDDHVQYELFKDYHNRVVFQHYEDEPNRHRSVWVWTRSPYASITNSWCIWNGSNFSNICAYSTYAVAPCFAI